MFTFNNCPAVPKPILNLVESDCTVLTSPGYSNTFGAWPCANNTQYGPTFSDAKSNGGFASDEFASCVSIHLYNVPATETTSPGK